MTHPVHSPLLSTIGPKVNHHFKFHNSAYIETEHPRWGFIYAVTTNRAIKAGKEVFTHYQYEENPFPEDFPWYFENELAIKREDRLQRETLKKSKLGNNVKMKGKTSDKK